MQSFFYFILSFTSTQQPSADLKNTQTSIYTPTRTWLFRRTWTPNIDPLAPSLPQLPPLEPQMQMQMQMQLCTYVIIIRSLPEIRKILKSYLSSEHEVVSARRMKFSTVEIIGDTDNNSSVVKHDFLQLKIKTRKPAYVASKLLGNNAWVKEHQGIVFKANPNKS